MLYEGNPDRTNIRERFVHKFEDPKPEEQYVPAETAPSPVPAPADPEPTTADVPDSSNLQAEKEMTMDEAASTAPQPVQPPPVVNGVKEDAAPTVTSPAKDDDTEMGGVS